MAVLSTKILSVCCVIIFVLMLRSHEISATRSKFQCVEKENRGGASKMDSGKTALFLLAKGHVPPSGPSHRGHDAPHFAHRSP